MAGVKGRSGGRNAKTARQHQVDGTFRKHRHDGIENPEPPAGKPEPPHELAGAAKAEWDRMVKRLEEAKTLSVVDDAVLYQYVQLFAEVEDTAADRGRLQELRDALMKRATERIAGGELVETIAKIVDLEYLLAKQKVQLRQGHIALKQMLVEFGMTPASRSRVRVTSGEDDDTSKPVSSLASLQRAARVLRFGDRA